MNTIEIRWAIKQLEALGYLESPREDISRIGLTNEGWGKGKEVLLSLPICDMILAILAAKRITEDWEDI